MNKKVIKKAEKRAPRCTFCKKVKHKKDCIVLTGIEGKDYLKCDICKLNFSELKNHYNSSHPNEKNPIRKISSSFEKRSAAQKGRENWITKYKREDPSLCEEKISKMKLNVSKTILNNQNERKRRSKLLSNLWKDPKFKENNIELASKTAIKTSSRPEILIQRSKQLENWRKENPDLFLKNCVINLCEKVSFKSKGEEIIFNYLKKRYSELEFKRNQFEYNENFTTKTKWRQIDIKCNELKLIIEYDGRLHFRFFNEETLQKIQNKDKEFNFQLKEKFLIIRLSYDVLNNKKTEIKKKYADELDQIINDQINEKKTGLVFIGGKYAKSNII